MLRAALLGVAALAVGGGADALEPSLTVGVLRGRTWSLDEGLPQASANAIAQDRDGCLWVATFGGLARFDGVRFEVFATATAPGLPSDRLLAVTIDRSGGLWVGAERQGLARLEGDVFETVREIGGEPLAGVATIVEGPSGTVWLGTATDLVRLSGDGTVRRFTTAEGLPGAPVWAVLEEVDGRAWLGTPGGGLHRLAPAAATAVPVTDLADGAPVLPVVGDGDGGVWVGLQCGGLVHWSNGRRTFYGRADGLASDCVTSLLRDADGTLWVGTLGEGLHRMREGRAEPLAGPRTRESAVRAILRRRDGSLVVGTDQGVFRWTGEPGGFEPIDGTSDLDIYCLAEDPEERLWAGVLDGVRVIGPSGVSVPPGGEDVAGAMVRQVHLRGDVAWLGTYGSGLFRLQGGRSVRFDTRRGLPENVVSRILEDRQGFFWLTGNRGVTRVARQDLEAAVDGDPTTVETRLFAEADGLPTAECSGGAQPAGWLDDEAMLWVPTIRGLARIDTVAANVVQPPPLVLIEEVVAGGRVWRHDRPIRLPPGVRDLEVSYTAPVFVDPERVRFRTRLEGLDPAWVEMGGRRSARYPYLPPGSYRFSAIARRDDSRWGAPSPAVDVVVEPRFVETPWFPLLLGVLAVVVVGAVAWLRLLSVRVRERVLEAEVASRTAELERLGALAERVNTALRLEDVLDHVYDSFRQDIPYDRIGFALVDSESRTVRAMWARGDRSSAAGLKVGYRAALDGSSLQQVLASGEPRIIDDLERYLAEHPHSESTRRIVADGLRSSLTCPLTTLGRPVGFLFFSSRRSHAYTAEHVRFFQRIARQVSHSVERSRLYDDLLETKRRLEEANAQLERLAGADPLTGVPNRRSLDAHLELEWRRGTRTRQPLALLMIDVDHFKRFNDAAGHAAGDDCLKRVAEALSGSLRRAGELVARYGGEEFVAILPDTPIDGARASGERLRAAVASLAITHPDSPERAVVTVSVGVAVVVPGGDTSPAALVEAADRALYRAKERGRNRVEVAE